MTAPCQSCGGPVIHSVGCPNAVPGAGFTAQQLFDLVAALPNAPADGMVYFCSLCRPSGMRTDDEMDVHMREMHQIGPDWREWIWRQEGT